MRSRHEHVQTLDRILVEATHVAEEVERAIGSTEAREILNFTVRFAHRGFPLSERDYDRGWWLDPARRGGPMTLEDVRHSFAVVLCFSGDPVPGKEEGEISGFWFGSLFRSDRLLVVYRVDVLPLFDAALVFLHEARHARQRYGRAFAGLPELDPPDRHEDRTWEFCLRMLDACGGALWHQAVEMCARDIEPALRYWLAHREGAPIECLPTVTYPLALDLPFGLAQHPQSQVLRTALLGARAYQLIADRAGIPEPPRYAEIFGSIAGL